MDPLTGVLIGSVVAAVVKIAHGHFSNKTITGRWNPKGSHIDSRGTHTSDANGKGDNFRL